MCPNFGHNQRYRPPPPTATTDRHGVRTPEVNQLTEVQQAQRPNVGHRVITTANEIHGMTTVTIAARSTIDRDGDDSRWLLKVSWAHRFIEFPHPLSQAR